MSSRSLLSFVAGVLALSSLHCANAPEKTGTPPQSVALHDEAPPVGQLPTDVAPVGYRLDLRLLPDEDHFSGRVEVDVTLTRARRTIWLHGAGLTVEKVEVIGANDARTPAVFSQVNDAGLGKVVAEREVGPGPVTLSFVYRADWDQGLKGLYKVVEEDRPYVFTQFEATSARYAFPCFDEPRFKTPFSIKVRAKPVHQVITTTPEEDRVVLDDGTEQISFARTRPLPTYLLAFAVGEFDVVETTGIEPNAVREDKLPLRGVAVKGRGAKLGYALDQVATLIDELETYFGRPYPFKKLDIIAVPDFASGAMENVGAVTFREYLLLVDEQAAPLAQRRSVVSVMAHEFAHMWFGNLVTMPWWDDIWLNESFATWMAARVLDNRYPEFDAGLRFRSWVQNAMGADSLASARQVRQPIKSDHDIRNAFDSITYAKGGAVLGMYESFLGAETFRAGIRSYMDQHAYGSATYEGLLTALDKAADMDVATSFKTFLFQPGVPTLDVGLDCAGPAPTLTVRQSRYRPLGSMAPHDKSRWRIPVCMSAVTGGGKAAKTQSHCFMLTEPEKKVELAGACPVSLHPNAGGHGYYRFGIGGYPIQLDLLDPAEQVAYADAVLAAFSAGTLDLAAAKPTLQALAAQNLPEVAGAPLRILSFAIDHLLFGPDKINARSTLKDLYRPVIDRLGLEPAADEDISTNDLRRIVLQGLVDYGEDRALTDKLGLIARRHLGIDIAQEDGPPDLIGVAISALARTADDATQTKLIDLALAETRPVERGHLIRGLATAPDVTVATRLLESGRLRKNEILDVIFGMFRWPEQTDEAFAAFTARYDTFIKDLPDTRQGALPWVVGNFCDPKKAEQGRAFFADKVDALPGGPRNLKGAVEAAALCAAKKTQYEDAARAAFGG